MDPRESLNTESDPAPDPARPVIDARPPTPEELRKAPFLWSWALVLGGLGLRLTGYVRGHPDNPEAMDIITSAFLDIDPGLAWARTENRYYRLGKPQDPAALALTLVDKWKRNREAWEKSLWEGPDESWREDWERPSRYAQWLKDNDVKGW